MRVMIQPLFVTNTAPWLWNLSTSKTSFTPGLHTTVTVVGRIRNVPRQRYWGVVGSGSESVSSSLFSTSWGVESSALSTDSDQRTTLQAFVQNHGGSDLALLFHHVGVTLKRLSYLIEHAPVQGILSTFPINSMGGSKNKTTNASGDVQKELDVMANEIVIDGLEKSRLVSYMASEENDEPIIADDIKGDIAKTFTAVFDPLDGSRNIDASIPVGTIMGIYHSNPALSAEENCLQAGSELVASFYTLYSSSTMLCLSLKSVPGAHMFCYDSTCGEFLLISPPLVSANEFGDIGVKMPQRGQIYSVNDARYFDWAPALREYVDHVRQGKGQSSKKYSARYVCSLVADFHRTLLYGGIAMNPRSHLRIVYEGNPLALIAEKAGGKAIDGVGDMLKRKPTRLHERTPMFFGSKDDIEEMVSYGDVRQFGDEKYSV